MGMATSQIFVPALSAQTCSVQFGATADWIREREGIEYSQPSQRIGVSCSVKRTLEVGIEYHAFRVERQVESGINSETGAHLPTVSLSLRRPDGSFRPYLTVGAGVTWFQELGPHDWAPPASLAVVAGPGLEVVTGRISWLVEGQALILPTDRLGEPSPALLWPFMLGMRVYLRR